MTEKPKLIASELRIGNLHYYRIKDDLDERKEWTEISVIDAHDILFLSENPDDDNYSPIPLSEDVLPKLGFKEIGQAWTNGFIALSYIVSDDYFQCEIRFPFSEWVIIPVKWVHTLQNITHSLTGEELKYTENQ